MAGGAQRKRSGPVEPYYGSIQAGGRALIGSLMFASGNYFQSFTTFGGTQATQAAARVGVLVSGSQDGHQADDRSCATDMGGEWELPLDVPANKVYPAKSLVAAAGDALVTLLAAGGEANAIGEVSKPVQIGDSTCTFKFLRKAKTT